MTATDLIALIAATALVLQNAARIPTALADLLRACLPVVRAARDLAATINHTPKRPTETDLPDDTGTP
ncbi:hypothetical protein GZH49_36425 [Nocardia terpenica]|uniref:hypothetical protein n=1 Tax=Nocardia terpenica TaxID=455432 RepID=UPI002FE20DE2